MNYKFQFNGDVISCDALRSMIKDGWIVLDIIFDDGYKFFLLKK